MERSDIAVADKNLGILPDILIIEQWQETCGTIAAAEAEDRLDGLVSKHFHEIFGSFLIPACEETPSAPKIGGWFWPKPQPNEGVKCRVDILGVWRSAGRSHDADDVSEIQASG